MRRVGSGLVPSQSSSSICEADCIDELRRDQRMCLHRVTESLGSLYVVISLEVIAERIVRRPGCTDAISAPSGEGTECCASLQAH